MNDQQSAILLERSDDGIRIVSMNDAAGNNGLSEAFVELLIARLEEVGADPEAKVCVLRGLPEIFCSGGDKGMLVALAHGQVAATDIMLPRTVLEVPIPTIAVMAGHAVGGGLTLGLCCDMVLMARQSRYGTNFMNMGFTPGMGTTRLLEDAMGPYLAAEMMFGGQYFRGRHFEGRSQINAVVDRADIDAHAMKLAGRIADKPRHALELLKRTMSLRKRQVFEEARTTESLMHELCFARPETKALIEEEYHQG